MFNFYVVSASADIVKDTDRSTTFRRDSKFHHYKKKYKKWKSFRKHEFE